MRVIAAIPASANATASSNSASISLALSARRSSVIRAALDAIERQPHVVAVEEPFATPDRLSRDGRTAYANVSYDAEAQDLDAAATRERLEDATDGLSGIDVAMSGEVVDGVATGGFPIGEVLGLLLALVLVLAVLRNLRAARNVIGTAFVGVGLGFGLLL